jgi:hypothetical protein
MLNATPVRKKIFLNMGGRLRKNDFIFWSIAQSSAKMTHSPNRFVNSTGG